MRVPPSVAWTVVFVPALCYFVATRMSQAGFRLGRSYHLGTTVTDRIQLQVRQRDNNKDPLLSPSFSLCEKVLSEIFYLSSCDDTTDRVVATLQYGVQQVFSASGGNMYMVASTWKHDAELGRGYLLWSDASQDGTIWRWEVGGGPIAIGRTLHLDRAGCRSGLYRQCSSSGTTGSADGIDTGSGGITIDFFQQEHASQGNLVIAEWGEGRIVRLEEVSGARTPLVIQVPDLCSNQSFATAATTRNATTRRLHQPHTLLYTPTGDLLFVDSQPECQNNTATNAVFRLKYAMHVPALADLKQSREAHAWKEVSAEASDIPEVLYTSAQPIGGIALMHHPDLSSILVSTKIGNSVLLVEVPLDDEDEDDEEDEGEIPRTSRHLIDLTEHIPSAKNPGALSVCNEGYAFVAVTDGIAVVDLVRRLVVGTIDLPVSPTSLTIGEDGFLYMTSRESLFRIGVRVKPVAIPVNKVQRKPKS